MEMYLLVLLLLVVVDRLFLGSVVVVSWCLCSNLCCNLSSVQIGKWQACRVDLIWLSSCAKACWSCETTLALCAKVLYTLCLAPI